MDSYQQTLNLCAHCGKTFPNHQKLMKHIAEVHDLRPKSCNQCDKRFVGAQQLRTHMKSHRKVRILPIEYEPFINFLRSCRDLHSVSVRSEFRPEDADFHLFNFRMNFDCLYEEFNMIETLKTILEHFE